MIKQFVSERGKIVPRRITGNCAKHQRKLTVEIKKARDRGADPLHRHAGPVGGRPMKVILREDVEKLGKAGEVVKVADGYGRNFLIPRQLAVLANVRNMKTLEHDRRVIETRAKKTRKAAEAPAATLSAVSLTLPAKAGEEGKLFGAITSRDIAEALEKAGMTVDRKSIQLAEPIKQLGDYKVKIRVAADVVPEISVSVVPKSSIRSGIHSGRGASMDGSRATPPAATTPPSAFLPTTSTPSRPSWPPSSSTTTS